MLVVALIFCALGLYSITLTICNICCMHSMRLKKQPLSPKVSVCIPARNEEANIERCVRSFMEQDYPNFEIIVLNDNSEDKTGEILDRLCKEDSRIRVISGTPVPEGWRGKVWAMNQLLSSATGDYILFTDADTKHTPISLRYGIDLILTNKAKLVSGYPREIFDRPLSGACVSIMVLNTMLYLPVFIQNRLQLTPFAMAIGQYMLVERKSLEEVGGVEPIKSANDDDVNLARLFCKTGHKQVFANMKYALSCMMYPNLKEAVFGMERCFLSAIKFTPIMLALMPLAIIFLLIMTLLPAIALVLLFVTHFSLFSILLTAAAFLFFVSYAVIANYHGYKMPVPLMEVHMFFFAALLLIRGLRHHFTKKEIIWKGRKVNF